MGNLKKQELFTKVLNLHRQNVTQKHIALRLGISEKTVYVWLKEIKIYKNDIKQSMTTLRDKLKDLLDDQNSSTEDIKNVSEAIKNLESLMFYK